MAAKIAKTAKHGGNVAWDVPSRLERASAKRIAIVVAIAFGFAAMPAGAAEAAGAQGTSQHDVAPLPTNASSAGAGTTASAPATAAPPNRVRAIPSGCESVGTVAEQIATWRDAHGSEYLAQIEVQRRLTDPAARNAALSIVSQLYTGFAKHLSPPQAKQAYSAACEAGDAAHGGSSAP